MIRHDDRKLINTEQGDHESSYNVMFHTITNLKMTVGYSRNADSDFRNMAHAWIRVDTTGTTLKENEMAADLMLNLMQHKCLFDAYKSRKWVPKPTQAAPEGNATDASPRRPDHESSSSGFWGAGAAAEAGVDEAVPTPLMPAISGQIAASSSSGEVGVDEDVPTPLMPAIIWGVGAAAEAGVDEAVPTPLMPAFGGQIAASSLSGVVGVGAAMEAWSIDAIQTPEWTPRFVSLAASSADMPEGIAYIPGGWMHQVFDGPHSVDAKGYFVDGLPEMRPWFPEDLESVHSVTTSVDIVLEHLRPVAVMFQGDLDVPRNVSDWSCGHVAMYLDWLELRRIKVALVVKSMLEANP